MRHNASMRLSLRTLKLPHPSLVLAGAWCALVLLRFAYWTELMGSCLLLPEVIDVFLILPGGLIAVGNLLYHLRTRMRPSAMGLAVITALASVAYTTDILSDFGIHRRLWFSRAAYDEIVTRVEAGEPRTVRGIRPYAVDRGSPMRLAFVWFGISDNWVGAVYDPTGLVMQSNLLEPDLSNWSDPEVTRARRLLGGDMIWARHIDGPWYLCGFT